MFIDSFDPKESVRYGFTDYCVHWLDAALRSMPDDYISVIFSHVPPLVRLQAWAKEIRGREKLMDVLKAKKSRALTVLSYIAVFALFAWCVLRLSGSAYNPFIYFKF